MTPDELRLHIDRLSAEELRALRKRVVASCWPGGQHDRTERSALGWLRRWWPERAGVAVPRCSCADGHCPVCN